MARLDLDDLPPKVAALLSDLDEGDEVLLVRHGAVVGRLTASVLTVTVDPDADTPPEHRMREVFENFRAAIEDEF